MPRLLTRSLAVLGAAMLALPAFAGETQPQVVEIDTEFMFADGDMVAARTDKNDETFIGCGTRNTDDGNGGISSWAFCQANDGNEVQVTCFTFNPELVKTIGAINDTSYITFSWTEDENGFRTCQRMGFSTQSFYLGKEVKGNKEDKKN